MPDKYNYPPGPQAIHDTHHHEPHWLAIQFSILLHEMLQFHRRMCVYERFHR